MLPSIVVQARADRAFLGRAIRYLAGEAGIRQFLDIGTGLPTADNTHEVAQRVAPEARIVYADNDPLVLLHARALLTSSPEGVCDYIDGDLREPDQILDQAARTLDFTQPVALMLLGIVHHIPDTDQAYSIVRRLTAALAPGSYLTINHSTSAVHGAAMEEAVAHWNRVGTPSMTLRTPQQIARFFDGLDLLEPGVVSCSRWRPDPSHGGRPAPRGRRILWRRPQGVMRQPPACARGQGWAARRDRPSTKMSMRSSKRSSGLAKANSSARAVMLGNRPAGSAAM